MNRVNWNKGKKNLLLIFMAVAVSIFLNAKEGNQIIKSVKKNKRSNVLVITLDTTRADKIGIYGCKEIHTSNLDSIASGGVIFKNVYSPVPLTLPAHCTIFTGTYPLYHKVRNNARYFLPDQVTTLAEILKQEGYLTAAFTSSFVVDSRFGLNQGFDVYNDILRTSGEIKVFNSERPAEDVFRDFSEWFSQNSKKKFFSWIHFFDPHLPYKPPEPYRTQYAQEPYLGEIAYVDFYVGEIFKLLKKHGILENTLIIIVGDHGEAFGEHGEFGHQIFCYEENLKVPFILFAKGNCPENLVLEERICLTDVAPTVLDFLRIRIPEFMQGISLIPLIDGDKPGPREFYIESVYSKENLGFAPITGIIKSQYKYLDLPKPELYDLDNDAAEMTNLLPKNFRLQRDMKKRLKKVTETYNTLVFDPKRKMSLEEERRLASLGYLSLSGKSKEAKNPKDPKDYINVYNGFLRAIACEQMKKYPEAEKILLKIVTTQPQFRMAYSILALVYQNSNQIEKAMETYREGLKNNPDYYSLKINFTEFLYNLKRYDEALVHLRELEALNLVDASTEVNLLFAEIYLAKNDSNQSAEYFQKVLKVEPENFLIKKKLAYCYHLSKNYRGALGLYLEIEPKFPRDKTLLHDIAILYAQLNDFEQSERFFRKLMGLNPHANIYFNYALLLAKRSNYKSAIFMMNKFISTYPNKDSKRSIAVQYINEWKKLAE